MNNKRKSKLKEYLDMDGFYQNWVIGIDDNFKLYLRPVQRKKFKRIS